MSTTSNSFHTRSELSASGKKIKFHSLKALEKTFPHVAKFPYSMKVLLENLLRTEDGLAVVKADIEALAAWNPKTEPDREIQFTPARTVLQDLTGVPAVADLAAMRDAMKRLGGNPEKINPLTPADLVIDHSVQVDFSGTSDSFEKNKAIEYLRNMERYQFLRWGQNAFKNFRVVPPETGIVHQVNLEYLAPLAMVSKFNGEDYVYPDTCVGTDSHTTMINGLGVVGWGVGGIEAEAAMLGQPICMLIPQVVGMKFTGKLRAGVTATDLVLTVTEMLRKKGVVGKFVEFYGPGIANLSLADRATVSNMAPEYGATIGIFPVDSRTCDYLRLTGRTEVIPLVEAYYKEQGMWFDPEAEPMFSDTLDLNLDAVEACLAGPSRPQDRVILGQVKSTFSKAIPNLLQRDPTQVDPRVSVKVVDGDQEFSIGHGSIVIAAITSCTNTSNPHGLVTAGLVAQKAVALGLTSKPWVKTSLAPGSKVVTDYLHEAGLLKDLEALRFHLVGYGCTTCIGNSGPLTDAISEAITKNALCVSSVLSGNRNFEGRIHSLVRANYLASPALVVAYAIAGSISIDLTTEPLGTGRDGKPVFLKDLWPTPIEVDTLVGKHVTTHQFTSSYENVFTGDEEWQSLKTPTGELYAWDEHSSYVKKPPFLEDMGPKPTPVKDIHGAKVLALLGDSITTDHISPAGSIKEVSPAGRYLSDRQVARAEFNSYGARRGNHEVMVRGTFANVRLKNKLVPGVEGGYTKYHPTGEQTFIFDASMKYQESGTPLMVIAGKEYGTGSSRDWAAKGTLLLGVRAVLTESFERIHRSNLVGMGVLPLQFLPGESATSHGLTGDETYDIEGVATIQPAQKVKIKATSADGKIKNFSALCRIDTGNELEYYKNGGILQYVLRRLIK